MTDAPTHNPLPAAFLESLRAIIGAEGFLTNPAELVVYECDAYTLEKMQPHAVVFPKDTEEVAAVVKLCAEHNLPIIPRGAGTSLSGAVLPVTGGVMIGLSRMNRIISIDYRNRRALVEAGCVNAHVTNAVKSRGLLYAPDPSSQSACTIGGNVATNSGGPHTLKYGVTVNHVRGVELVLPDGSILQTGGVTEDNPGYDMTGVIVGHEGTFGIVTKITVGLARDPEAG